MDIKPFSRKEKIIVFFACALGWAHDAIGLTLITFFVGPISAEFGLGPQPEVKASYTKTKSPLKNQTASNTISTTKTLCHYHHKSPVTIE